ncbi:response regulator [Cytobacillus depressus]|uniref:Response regulator n=1 Tax=Cytobacillus depressus TaxID=1602942 RepID=A0A6L3VAA6_9BACI|nr:response regulator [Cytobacillus depressus]KAB2336018.1 response regulator [Cytobacillus depressus]
MITVLIIEDDPMVQEVNKQFVMKMEGFKVIGAASNGVEGLEKIQELSPDVVILDVYMPEQDGLETLQQIRSQQESVDVIMVTAANDHETVKMALQNGAFDYIIKPFKFDRIQKALEKYKIYHSKFKNERSLSQQQLDEFLHSPSAPKKLNNVNELPKGLNEVTYKQIISYLREQELAKSSEEVADGVGIARVTARRYLDYLVKLGDIKIELKYGGVGRPVNRYSIIKQTD